jgi:hypothetical protein
MPKREDPSLLFDKKYSCHKFNKQILKYLYKYLPQKYEEMNEHSDDKSPFQSAQERARNPGGVNHSNIGVLFSLPTTRNNLKRGN